MAEKACVNGGGKVWRLAGKKCSARVVEGPRGSVVGGSRRGFSEAFLRLSWTSDNYFVFVAASHGDDLRFLFPIEHFRHRRRGPRLALQRLLKAHFDKPL